LTQTAVETGKPLQDIVRAYATGCFSWYAARLNRFAASLESGLSLEAAVRANKGLFRYNVAGMIRLGGDASETLRSLETVAEDERNFSAIRTNNVVRIVYLCALIIQMLSIMTSMFTYVVPEFNKIFQDLSSDLPVMTAVVIEVSQCFVCYWYLLPPFMLLIALAAITYLILQTSVVVFRPIGLRRIFRSTDAAKFLMVFAVGVRHRFPISAILEMYRWTVPSDYLRNKGSKIQLAVEQGHDWIDAVRRAGFVNRPEASLLKSAQRTGNTAAVLDQLALSKERSQIRNDDLFSKLAFIPLILLLGVVIGAFVIAMFLPLVMLIRDMSGG
jgi:general secretion pathway protein F